MYTHTLYVYVIYMHTECMSQEIYTYTRTYKDINTHTYPYICKYIHTHTHIKQESEGSESRGLLTCARDQVLSVLSVLGLKTLGEPEGEGGQGKEWSKEGKAGNLIDEVGRFRLRVRDAAKKGDSAGVWIRVCVCVYVCMYVCVCMHVCTTDAAKKGDSAGVDSCVCVYVCMCVYACMYY